MNAEPPPRAVKVIVHIDYADGTSVDLEAVEPLHVGLHADETLPPTPVERAVVIVPHPERGMTAGGSAVERERRDIVARMLGDRTPF